MPRRFNVSGMCFPDRHHMLPPLELKIRRDEKTLQQGLEQLGGYLDRLGLPEGFLILFERSARPWSEKLFESAAVTPTGQRIHVFGM